MRSRTPGGSCIPSALPVLPQPSTGEVTLKEALRLMTQDMQDMCARAEEQKTSSAETLLQAVAQAEQLQSKLDQQGAILELMVEQLRSLRMKQAAIDASLAVLEGGVG